MKILLLTQFLSTTRGGGEYVFSEIANEIAKKGNEVWVITHNVEGENYSSFHKNVKIIFASSVKYEGGIPPTFKKNFQFVASAIIKGLKLIKKEKIDLIHSNNFSPALVGSILSSLLHIPHIICIHDVFSNCGKNYWNQWAAQQNVSKIHAFLGPRFEKMIPSLSHVLIHTVSESTKDDILKLGEKKPIRIISNAIKIKPTSDVKINPNQFVYVGRLVFYKNLETIIQAVSLVKKVNPKIKLLVVGNGPQKSKLENLVEKLKVEENVSFLGFVSELKKNEAIASSLSMVFPSVCEGFGLVILESFLQKRPVMVSDVRPLNEIVCDKKNGFVVPPFDSEKWAEAMISLIENQESASKMGLEGNRKLGTEYNQSSMINKVEEMYREVLVRNN